MSDSVKSFLLSDLADVLDVELVGNGNARIQGLSDLRRAEETHISFLSSVKYVEHLADTLAAAVIIRPEETDLFDGNKLLSDNPYLCYAKLSALFETRSKRECGIHPSACIDPSAIVEDGVAISANCVIGAGAYIGANTELYPGVFIGERARVGANCILFPNVVIYHDVVLGEHVRIHANSAVGSDGFGYAPTTQGWEKIHQIGAVVIGDRVEIGSSVSIDRGALGDTIIHDDVIIDNQVHIAHNVEIGQASAIAGCVGIAGSAVLGKRCQVAGAVAINGHIDIADGSVFHGGTIVTKGNIESGVFASAPPLQAVAEWRKNSVRYRQLGELFSRVKKIEKLIDKT